MTNTRRLMMSNGGGDLPSGYTRLEYIETDKGGFFMDLPTFPTDVVVLDCQLPNLPVFESGTGHVYNPIIYNDGFKQCSLQDQKG